MLAPPEQILDALDPEQRAVAEAIEGPVRVLAGAGTGKTRAITHRIAHGVRLGAYQPANVLAVTFTTRAAGEMRTRLRALGAGGVQARTFHSAALRQLQYFWPRAVGGEPPRIAESKAPIVATAASRLGIRPGQAEVRDLSAEIEWAKVCQIAPADYARTAAGREPPAGLDHAGMADAYAAYEDAKRSRGVMDMEDILLLTAGVLAENDDVAETVRRQYRHLVVDEYQDVNPLQQRLVDLWLGGGHEVCVVGDPHQTIYSFAGASPRYLLEFTARHSGATLVELVRNYRSTPQIVAVANAVRAGATPGGAGPRPIPTQPGRAQDLTAQNRDGPVPQVSEHPDAEAEADAVAARIAELRAAGTAAAQIAVLFRTNAQSLAYEQALGERGVPYLLRGGERFFDRPEVREARVLLRGAARAAELGTDGDRLFDPVRSDGAAAPGAGGLVDAVRDVLAGAGLHTGAGPPQGAAAERAGSLAALVSVAEELAAADPAATLSTFAAELETRAADAHVPTVDGVTLASLHAAKGLEWDVVFVVGLVEGLLPISYAETEDEVAEERRLFYVAVTRARRALYLSWGAARSPGGRGRDRSRFLTGLGPGATGVGPAPARRPAGKARAGRKTPRCRVCDRPLPAGAAAKLGRCEDCPADLDEALLARLKDWRLERARAQSQPAFCVFTDATLLAIAETGPAGLAELAAIPGIGAAKLDRYGADVLAICAGDTAPSGDSETDTAK